MSLLGNSEIQLKNLGQDYDPTSKCAALEALMKAEEKQVVLTGLLYLNTEQKDFLMPEGRALSPPVSSP